MEEENLLRILRLIGNNSFLGITVIDEEGIVLFRNKGMGEISGIKSANTIGKKFSEVTPDSSLLEVLRTGVPQFGVLYSTPKGNKAVIHRIPLKEQGHVFGAMSIAAFYDVMELQDILKKHNLLQDEVRLLKSELRVLRGSKYNFSNIIGVSQNIQELKRLGRRYAAKLSNVLITGESGTGKEIFAHAIHRASTRNNGPLIRLNCSCFPRELLESELFGYEGGSFTGAKRKGKPGKFELADNGTIFFDEIGDFPLEMQPKLLRVLEEKEVWRIGGTTPRRTNFRLITATNKDLNGMVEEGRFRHDLYFRLTVLTLEVLPLRNRKEDIPFLAEYLLAELNSEMGTSFSIGKHTIERLMNYDWPGNVRELRNILERAIAVTEKNSIEAYHLPPYIRSNEDMPLTTATGESKEILQQELGKAEKEILNKILANAAGNKAKAARLLGISRTCLYDKLKKHGIVY
ncbi:MAG: sigma 54-interacting transcriptional regulator [Desulfobacterales bacterium]|nr:sigma 54-interacting transcriptional regulator [Desulfobacterales bacterium]